MIPNIRTLAHIDTVVNRLPQWRGDERVQVLEACKRCLHRLRTMKQIDAATFKAYNTKVLPKLAKAKILQHGRLKAAADKLAVAQMLSGPEYQAWYNAAVLGYGQLQD